MIHLQPDPQRSDWRIDHHVATAFLPLPSNSDDDVFMTRPLAGGGEEEKEPRRGGGKERKRWSEVLFLSFVDGKLWHIDHKWPSATARPARQTECQLKTKFPGKKKFLQKKNVLIVLFKKTKQTPPLPFLLHHPPHHVPPYPAPLKPFS